jgi:YqaJ-like viral recombinase domain
MPIIEVQQQSDEWLKMRCGCLTSSRLAEVITRLKKNTKNGEKGGYSQKRENYLWEVVGERLTGRAAEHYVSKVMDYGSETEPLAKAEFEVECGVSLLPGRFALHDSIEWFGASIDSLDEDDPTGGYEFKCLQPKNHARIIDTGEIPEEHLPQMLGEMACYNLQWVEFVSFCGDAPKDSRVFRKRMNRDEALVQMIEAEAKTFLEDVILKLGRLAERAAASKAARAETVNQ